MRQSICLAHGNRKPHGEQQIQGCFSGMHDMQKTVPTLYKRVTDRWDTLKLHVLPCDFPRQSIAAPSDWVKARVPCGDGQASCLVVVASLRNPNDLDNLK